MKTNTMDIYRAEELRMVSQRLFDYDINRATIDEFPVDLVSQLRVLLALEQDVALRLICEYKKFLLLVATVSGDLTPSQLVDEVWHLHLETSDYADQFCPSVFGCTIAHIVHEANAESRQICRDNYRRTLDAYRERFGDPPADIWGEDDASLPYAQCAAGCIAG